MLQLRHEAAVLVGSRLKRTVEGFDREIERLLGGP